MAAGIGHNSKAAARAAEAVDKHGLLTAQIKALQAQLDECRDEIIAAGAGEHLGRFFRGLVAEAAGAERLDTKALRAAHPKICAQFMARGEPTTRVIVKPREDVMAATAAAA